MEVLDPESLVITRRRKKWKFANFDSFENCFELQRNDSAAQVKKAIRTHFSRLQGRTLQTKRLLCLELAAGNAQFSLELARRHPELDFIAVDIKSDRLYQSAKKALEEGIKNIVFVRTHMNELANIFSKNSVDEIWLTFPDPFEKKRSAKHRLTHPHFLKIYQQILKKNGQFKFKTDNRNLFLWSLEQFVNEGWNLKELSFDLHESNLSNEYKIKTYYEQKYTEQNITINFVAVTKK